MGLNEKASVTSEQLRYARVMSICVRVAFILLAAGGLGYFSGVLTPVVPYSELPRLWVLPASGYLAASGVAGGWGWIALMDKGDMLSLAGIALLAGVSVPSLLVIVPAYAARRDWIYLGIAIALAGVIVFAASGVFGTG